MDTINKYLNRNKEKEEEDDEEGKSSGGSGGSETAIAYEYFVAGFVARDEGLNKKLSETITDENRVTLKSMGYKVDALDKNNDLNNNLANNNRHRLSNEASNAGGGPSVQQHPELANEGGKADKIVLPQNEDPNNKSNMTNKNKNQLKNRNTLTMKAQHKHKHKVKMANKPVEKPRFAAKHTPKPDGPNP